jgi:CRP-like cAMP-binding protein
VVRQRFSDAAVERIEASRWWRLDRAALADLLRREPDLLSLPSA